MSTDEFGQLLVVGTDMERKKKTPNGSYDMDILCRTCDNKLGDYDDYALNFVKKTRLLAHPSGKFWTADGVDQSKLKLFCMSYLWRASITTREEFSGIDLGIKHETRIRELLLSGDSGTPDQFTTIFSKFSNADEMIGAIMFPARTHLRKLTYYEGYLPRLYKFWVKVDSQNDEVMSAHSLGAHEVMVIHNRGDFDTSIEKELMVQAARRSN